MYIQNYTVSKLAEEPDEAFRGAALRPTVRTDPHALVRAWFVPAVVSEGKAARLDTNLFFAAPASNGGAPNPNQERDDESGW
jgi:hypothetical protein